MPEIPPSTYQYPSDPVSADSQPGHNEVSFTDDTLLQAAPGNLSSDLDDETVVLSVDRGVYYGMNPVAAFVWHRLEEALTFGAVCQAIMAEFDVDEDTCRRDLTALLGNLVNAGLVRVERQAA